MFKKILIPVDDSRCSEQAGEYGLELAKRFGSSVLITHIVAELPRLYSGTDWAKELLGQGKLLVESWQKKGSEAGVALKANVIAGQEIAATILHSASENACDLIVMGTHGRKGLAHVLLGSVAERVTRLAKIPVMLVRESKHATALTWQRILVAVDGSEASRKALQVADKLARQANAELHLLHVIPDVPPPLVDPIGVGGVAASLTYGDTVKELEHDARIVMEVSRAEIDTEKTVFYTARAQRERIPDVIVRYAREQSCDLIVMGTHGRTGLNHLLLGSVAEGVAHTTPVPLLLIHVADKGQTKSETSGANPAKRETVNTA